MLPSFVCANSDKSFLVRCPCAFRLPRLAQNGCPRFACSPHHCVGFLFLGMYLPDPSPPDPPPPPPLPSHTIVAHYLSHIPSLSHTFPHHLCRSFHTSSLSHITFHTHRCHTSLSHTIFHTPSLSHITFHTHLCHTSLSHTIFHTPSLSHTFFVTPLCHTPSFTSFSHLFVTRHLFTHHLCHTSPFTHIFVTPLCHTPSFTHMCFTPLCHTTSCHTHLCNPHHLCHTSYDHKSAKLQSICNAYLPPTRNATKEPISAPLDDFRCGSALWRP